MTPSNFQFDIFKKIVGKNFPPGGSDPQNFLKSGITTRMVMCLQIFIQLSLKLWPVDVGEEQGDRKQTKKQTSGCPAKTGSPIALTHIPLDRGGGT